MVSGSGIAHIRSCGCLHGVANRKRLQTHGKTGTRVYRIWNAMRQRCGNPNQPHYPRYGGLGVTVCDAWQKFDAFYADMGEPPTESHTLDRIDPAGNYEPANCRWATYLEQRHNRRPA